MTAVVDLDAVTVAFSFTALDGALVFGL